MRTHDRRIAALLRRTVPAAGPAQPAGAVVAVARDAAAAAPRRVSADPAVVRDRAEGGDPVADAVVAHLAAADRRGAGDPCRGRADLESAKRGCRRPQRAA